MVCHASFWRFGVSRQCLDISIDTTEPLVLGPLVIVAAGFSDGEHVTVEPLAECTMLPSPYHRREKRLAQVLCFVQTALDSLKECRYTCLPLSLAYVF